MKLAPAKIVALLVAAAVVVLAKVAANAVNTRVVKREPKTRFSTMR